MITRFFEDFWNFFTKVVGEFVEDFSFFAESKNFFFAYLLPPPLSPPALTQGNFRLNIFFSGADAKKR